MHEVFFAVTRIEADIDAYAVNKRRRPQQNAHYHESGCHHGEIFSVKVEFDDSRRGKQIGKREQYARARDYKHKREHHFIEARDIARSARQAVPADTGGEIRRDSFQSVCVEARRLYVGRFTLEKERHQIVVVSFVNVVGREIIVDIRQEEYRHAQSQANDRGENLSFFVGVQYRIVLQFHGDDYANQRRRKTENRDKERTCLHFGGDARQRFERKTRPRFGFRRNGSGVGGGEFVSVEVIDVRNINDNQRRCHESKSDVQHVDKSFAERFAVFIVFIQRKPVYCSHRDGDEKQRVVENDEHCLGAQRSDRPAGKLTGGHYLTRFGNYRVASVIRRQTEQLPPEICHRIRQSNHLIVRIHAPGDVREAKSDRHYNE